MSLFTMFGKDTPKSTSFRITDRGTEYVVKQGQSDKDLDNILLAIQSNGFMSLVQLKNSPTLSNIPQERIIQSLRRLSGRGMIAPVKRE